MTVGATPSGVPPGVAASNGFEAPRPDVSPVSLGGMTTGALPVGLISLDNDPEDKEVYEASGDDDRLKVSKGNQNAVIKTLWLRIGSSSARGQTDVVQR
jgi:hypothetical protein